MGLCFLVFIKPCLLLYGITNLTKLNVIFFFKNTEDGGLGLKNLPLMFKSLKVTWVNRLSKMSPTHPLSILVKRQLRHVGGDLIWQCTTSVSDVE